MHQVTPCTQIPPGYDLWKKIRVTAGSVFCSATLFCTTLSAQTQSYDSANGSNVWDLATTNWDGSTVVWTNGNNAIFGGTGESVSVNAGVSVGDITFNSTGYTLADGAGSLTLANPENIITVTGAGTTVTIAETIDGALGQILTKAGAGTLILTGANTYLGPTTVKEGILEVSGTGVIDLDNDPDLENLRVGDTAGDSGALRVVSGGTVLVNNSVMGFGAGSTGVVTVDNATLSNAFGLYVGYQGTGTLNIQNGATVSVNNTSYLALFPDSAATVTVDNALWINSGDVFLGYIGDSTITLRNGGTVDVAGIARLGDQVDSTGVLNIGDGGTAGVLNTPELRGGDGTATLNFNHNEAAYTFSPNITGSTRVTHNGSGTTILNGINTYAGGLTINSGVVEPGGASALGSGNVTLQGGELRALSSTLSGQSINVAGDYTQTGGTLTLRVFGVADYDQLSVGGTATLGGTLALSLQGSYVSQAGDQLVLVDAFNPIAGNFSVVNVLGNAIFYTTTRTDDYTLTVLATQASFTTFSRTPNQLAVANGLDATFGNPLGQPVIDYLNSLPGSDLPTAFDLISPSEFSALSATTFSNTRSIFNIMGNRLDEIRSGQQFSANGLTLWDPGKIKAQNLSAAAGEPVPGMKFSVPARRPDDKKRGFFVAGSGTLGDRDGDGTAEGYDFSTGGMVIGGDYRITENLAAGYYGGYQGSVVNFNSGGKSESDSAKFGVFAAWWHEKGSKVALNIGGGLHSYTTERAALGGTAQGKSDGTELNTQLLLGHDFKAGRNQQWQYGPEASLGYTRLWLDAFTESGSVAPLTIQEQTADSLVSTLSFKARYDWKIREWTLRPYARAGWQYEFMDRSQAITARFASGAGGLFSVQGAETERDSLVGGAGAQLLFSETISALLGYSVEANADYEIHQVNGSINFRF
jgi:T5SS/PEP-CTERM-associated repeat protein/autotransporter-associated beta strand protein